jgi:peptidoglycan/LPS O-acetylase OafA/YrhL
MMNLYSLFSMSAQLVQALGSNGVPSFIAVFCVVFMAALIWRTVPQPARQKRTRRRSRPRRRAEDRPGE